MKTKGITIWEQHLEHFVLGIAALIFVALTALQFIGNPNSVTIDGREVPPDEVDEIVKAQAERLEGRLRPDAAAAIEIPDPEPVLETFNALRVASINPDSSLDLLQYRVAIGSQDGVVPTGEPFAVPGIPAPYEVAVRQYFDALSEDSRSIIEEYPALQEMVSELPHDLTWITASAKFDVGEVREQYQTPSADGGQPIPVSWYDDRIDLLDLRVEREEYVDGEWINQTLLEPIPGQVSFRAELTETADSAQRDRLTKAVSDPLVQNDVIRPEFYPTLNAVWTVPDESDEAIADSNEDPEITRLRLRLSSVLKRRATVAELLDQLGGAMSDDPGAGGRAGAGGGSSTGGSSGGGGGGDGIFGGGGASSGGGGGDASTSSTDRRRRSLTRKLEKLNEQVASLEKRLGELLGDDEVVTDEMVEDEPVGTLVVWAHDLTVEPGREYRYRFTVDLLNPFFARRISLVEGQHHLADGLTMKSPTSEWSQPLLAQPPLRAYIVRASAPERQVGNAVQQGNDLGTATVEVYRFSNGRWWESSFRVQPGDRVGKMDLADRRDRSSDEIDFRTDWFVLDIVASLDADRVAMERGWAATVLLQSLTSGDRIVVRDPRDDAQSMRRGELKDLINLAGTADGVAMRN